MTGDRALVTGATGFLGRALVAALRSEGLFVRGTARTARPSTAHEFVVADLSAMGPDSTLLAGIDTVYHLAAKTHDLSEARGVEREYTRVNVEGTRRLLELARATRIRRLVFVSSVKVVGEGGEAEIDESTVPSPTTPYGRSKLAAERLVSEASAAIGFEQACLRFPIMYGPGQRGNLERMIAAIERRRFPPPPPNRNKRSMLHVENAVQALILAARHPLAAGETFFVTDARPYSTRETYEAVCRALGRRPASWSVPEPAFRALGRAGDLARALAGRRVGFDTDAFQKLLGSAWYSSRKITSTLGYEPRRDLVESMPELIASMPKAVAG